ncbi:MAG TPA: zinc-ribbon domain-containing protein, partial [Candidatus Paceibacterota bacterium]
YQQLVIYYYLKKIFSETILDYRTNDNIEADIYIPNIKLAIEYDGWFWHKNKKNKDILKSKYFLEHKCKLIRIRENGLDIIKQYNCTNIQISKKTTNDELKKTIIIIFKFIKNNYQLTKCNLITFDNLVKNIDIETEKLFILQNRTFIENKNSLETLNPKLSKEWHPYKNGILNANNFRANSHIKVWWKCKNGHEWRATIKERYRNNRKCPYCENRILTDIYNLKTMNPLLAEQWHPTKNGKLLPQSVFPNTDKKVWWKCKNGHEWETTVNNRNSHGKGCPYCTGRLLTPDKSLVNVHPEIAEQWNLTKNGELKAVNVSSNSNKKVWWTCPYCNYEYQRIIANQTKKDRTNRCPNCKKYLT